MPLILETLPHSRLHRAWIGTLVLVVLLSGTFSCGGGSGSSNQPPPSPLTVSISAPAQNATVSGTVSVSAIASGPMAISNVQFLLDGAALGAPDTSSPFSVSWDTTTATNGNHSLAARATDVGGNRATSTTVGVTVSNSSTGNAVTWDPSVLLSANSGYVDTNTRQVVRVNTTNTVYICGLQGGGAGSSWISMWKGSPDGSPTSFTEMDAAHRPSNNSEIEGAECRLQDNSDIIHVSYQDDSANAEKYIQFNTSTGTWGTAETVGNLASYLQVRYESKNALCLDSSGTAWILWGGAPSSDSLHLSHRTGTNSYSSPETVTTTQVFRPACAWDAGGNLNIAYMNYSSYAVLFKQRLSSGSYSSEETVSSAVDPSAGVDNGPSIVFDHANGNAVVDYLTSTVQGSSSGQTTYTPNAKERTGTNTWVNIFSVPQTTGGHSPAAYVDYLGNFYQFMGHGDTDPSQPVVARYNGTSWTSYTDIAANQGSTVMDCSANIRYDILNPSSPYDIDFVGCVENYGTNNARLVYAHGAIQH